MARKCDLTGVGVMSGNNVSHSNRKTRTRFLPNLRPVSLISDALGLFVRLNITAAALRSVEHNGGIDNFLAKASSDQLSPKARRYKREIVKSRAGKKAA